VASGVVASGVVASGVVASGVVASGVRRCGRCECLQALVSQFGLWQQEWAYTEEMLQRDLRNNSAWSVRAWLLGKCMHGHLINAGSAGEFAADNNAECAVAACGHRGVTCGSMAECMAAEVAFAGRAAAKMPHSDSSWNYLVGLRSILCDAVFAHLERGAQSPLPHMPRSLPRRLQHPLQHPHLHPTLASQRPTRCPSPHALRRGQRRRVAAAPAVSACAS
jgi:Protein prenyltransferase alpha subunit repeat